MTARRYKSGQDRLQTLLLPSSIEDDVSPTNPVCAIDAYAETLDDAGWGFQYAAVGISPGQPAFPPAMLAKLDLYGYLNGLHSSRKLEREAARNLEVICLAGNLPPRYKTIANFHKDNRATLKAVNKDFILLCKQLELFGGDTVAVDGRQLL